MGRDSETRNQGLGNASVNTSVRGGGHDGEADDSTPSNLGLHGNDQQKGLEATAGGKKPKPGADRIGGNPEAKDHAGKRRS